MENRAPIRQRKLNTPTKSHAFGFQSACIRVHLPHRPVAPKSDEGGSRAKVGLRFKKFAQIRVIRVKTPSTRFHPLSPDDARPNINTQLSTEPRHPLFFNIRRARSCQIVCGGGRPFRVIPLPFIIPPNKIHCLFLASRLPYPRF